MVQNYNLFDRQTNYFVYLCIGFFYRRYNFQLSIFNFQFVKYDITATEIYRSYRPLP